MESAPIESMTPFPCRAWPQWHLFVQAPQAQLTPSFPTDRPAHRGIVYAERLRDFTPFRAVN